MEKGILALQNLLGLFLQSLCPLCRRSTAKEFCHDCQQQLEYCQIDNPERFWQGDLPLFTWGVYSGAMKRAMKALKYDNQPQVAKPLGDWLARSWLNSFPSQGVKATVVPIPLHANKLRDRGYNQAELLARSFCDFTGLPLQPQGLERVRETKAQFTLSEVEREKNLAGAFELGKGFRQRHPTSPVLLLDDIYTTGKTARYAARTLRDRGIQVYGIVAIATPRKE